MSRSIENIVPRSLVDVRATREIRANDNLKMKDERIRILTEQNNKLIGSLDAAEAELEVVQRDTLRIEEESRVLRESNFEVQSNARSVDSELKKLRTETSDREKQLKVMTEQNGELLRLLENEETNNAKMASECENNQSELEAFKEKYGTIVNTGKTHEEMATKALREGQLQAEEIRLLRTETEHVKQKNNELKMKSTVELESLQEQLRVRKEKQYQLLEKLQGQEEARRQAEDQVSGMEEKVRELQTKLSDTETQLQVEINSKLSQEEANRKLRMDSQMLSDENKELGSKFQKSEQDRLRIEAEARDSGEQLREMAEKVFQLLERLKLADLGKNRSLEALRNKEQEVLTLKKKNSRLIKESTKEGKARVKAELEKRDLQYQIRALKKHNTQLGQRCKEEAKMKLREETERKDLEEKVRTLNSRLSFLLNKLQSDEESKVVHRDETKKLEEQLQSKVKQCEDLQRKMKDVEEKHREIVQEIHEKQEELNESKRKLDALQRVVDEHEEDSKLLNSRKSKDDRENKDPERRIAGGRLRFFVESKPTLGLVAIKGKRTKDREWIEQKGCNNYLRKALKSSNVKEMLIKQIAEMYGVAMVQEEEFNDAKKELNKKEDEMKRLSQKREYLLEKLNVEEESKRRTLIKYVSAVKASVSLGEPGCEHDRNEVGRVGAGRIQLPEANLSDEEVHAIAATIRGNISIIYLNLRGNIITDEGARVLAAVLAGPSALKIVDLRGNRIGRPGLRAVAEALERSARVRHVYVHGGGKIEALGTAGDHSLIQTPPNASPTDSNFVSDNNDEFCGTSVSVHTVCVVDIRENKPTDDPFDLRGQLAFCDVATKGDSNQPQDGADLSLSRRCPKGDHTDSKVKKPLGKTRKRAEERLSRDERGKRRQAKQIQQSVEQENSKKEKGWMGRAGGLETSLSRSIDPDLNRVKCSPTQRQKRWFGEPDFIGGFPPVRPYSAGAEEVRSRSAPDVSGPPLRCSDGVEKGISGPEPQLAKLQISPFLKNIDKKDSI